MASTISFREGNSGFQAGIINGPVDTYFHHHAPPERPETPPNPSIVIPFSRDTDFVERGVLDQIHQKCAVSGSRIALVGLGGVGKSQLAIEYAYRTRDRSPDTWVFWVHASNAARLEKSFRDIANRVKVPGRRNLTANIFQLVHDWLCDEKKGKWVFILDNVDDAGFLVEAPNSNQDGHTNSRGSEKVERLVEYLPQRPHGSILMTTRSKSAALKVAESRDIIVVEPMNRSDGLALFKKKLGWHDDSEDANELAAVLNYMPLAIVQATTYISQRLPRYTVRQYLQDFRKSDSKRTSLLNCDGGQLRRDSEAKNSIIIVWQISFEYILDIRLTAADLLSLISFFDRHGIPEILLRCRQGQSQYNQENKLNDKHRFEDDLLVLRNYSFISVNANSTTFEMHGLIERWKREFIRNLDAELPTGEYENWEKSQKPEESDSLREWASILYKAAWYAWRMGKGVEAENMSIHAMKVRKQILGNEHNDTLSGMAMAGLAYKLNGRWDAAKELELGVDHPDTLASISNLASTYRNQGRWDNAEKLELDIDHPDTLSSIANLALIYQKRGLIETRKTKLGVDHPDTLASRWDEAKKLEVQVLETRKTKLGMEHPDTLYQGRWDEAKKLELGVEHPDTLVTMGNLAVTYKYQGRWDNAEKLEVQVMKTRKMKLGADHPDTLASRWDGAEKLFLQVMETRKTKLGIDHPDTLSSMGNLALTWKRRECVRVQNRVLGPTHPDSISSRRALDTWKAKQEVVVSSKCIVT
ncbi:P-loop containing nucleoside triphosphate hydrolase protein [Amylocarpus encephaloides]|uniref:P-loop containing nucleoside triphosphate hydrolase protein n=1 Tax=Amylocarpus encephaloides TaxID=45428 RepID=A0A9P8C3K6_9HELO|nr:P-loop containing nucleoside triphosphate hydrolase protein [Amylocarpus encephaloides]